MNIQAKIPGFPALQRRLSQSMVPAVAFALMFSTLMSASSLSRADDLDIYTKATAKSSGTPTMMMLFDTSQAASYNLLDSSGGGTKATSLLHESSANMKDALRAMMTSGPDNLKIGLADYTNDGTYDNGRIRHEMVRVGDVAFSSGGAGSFTGEVRTQISASADDAAQPPTGGVRLTETVINIPYKISGNIIGNTVTGNWTSSAGSGLPDTCCDGIEPTVAQASSAYAVWSNVTVSGAGNRYFYYRPGTSTSATFTLTPDSYATNTVLFLVDPSTSPYTIKFLNDDAGTTFGCDTGDSGPTGKAPGTCTKGSGSTKTTYKAYITDQSSKIVATGLTLGHDYMLIVATRSAGSAGNFTLTKTGTDAEGEFSDPVAAATPQKTGFRFTGLSIPQGATISSAKLVFQKDSGSGPLPFVKVGLDSNTTPSDFSVTDINSRSVSYKAAEQFDNGAAPEVDVASLVSAQVAKSGWCPGNAMAFVIAPVLSVTDLVRVHSYDDNPARAAELVIEYDKDSGDHSACTQKSVELKVESMSEDTTQFADGKLDIDKAYMPKGSVDGTIADQRGNLWISEVTKVGLRFSLVPIPVGATIVSAKLYLTARWGSPQLVHVHSIMEESGIVKAFLPDPNYLDDVTIGSTLEWKPAAWVPGTEYEVDVTSLVVEQVGRGVWFNYSTLGFRLDGREAATMKACAWEYGPGGGFASIDKGDFGSCRARLVITFNTNGAAEETTYRKVLVDDMALLDKTIPGQPMGAAYLKAAEYLAGYFAAMKADAIKDGAAPAYSLDGAGAEEPVLASGACSSNSMVFIADNNEGAAYNKSAYQQEVADFVKAAEPTGDGSCSVSGSGSNMSGKNCTVSVASALFDDGDNGLKQVKSGKEYSVKTYPINFGATAGGGGGGGGTTGGGTMRGIASAGGGTFYQSGSSGELVKQLLSILGAISDQGAAVAAPGISVNALNRFEHLDQLYYSLFKPSTTVDWPGNLKRYQLLNSDVADIAGAKAVLTGTKGFFDTNAQSWWSGKVDGADVTSGGAADETIEDKRRIFTYLGDNSSVSEEVLDEMITTTNTNLDEFVVGVDRLSEYQQKLPPFDNQDGINATTVRVREFLTASPNKQRFWAAAIHASPRIVAFNNDPVKPIITVFYGDNRGFIHAIDGGGLTSSDLATNLANTGGQELFAFLPQELLKNAALLEQNTQAVLSEGYIYGMDGDMTLIRKDTDANADMDKVWLYAGMRRGGSNYYALDVSKARADIVDKADLTPTLKWVIEGGVDSYADMGETWSAMSVNKVNFKGESRQVLVFTGGHDAAVHDIDAADPTSTTDGKAFRDVDQKGRGVYMVDADTGELLWRSSDDVSRLATLSKMKYSMTATPRLIDRNADGMVDGMYVVDLAGQVFRFDFSFSNTGATDLVSAVTLVAQLGATGVHADPVTNTASGAPDPVADNRRIYDSPSVAFIRNDDGSADVLLAITTGYREQPYNNDTNEIVVFIRDRGAFGTVPVVNSTLTLADLEDITAKTAATDTTKSGWYFFFDKTKGERGIGSPVIFNNAILWSTFVLDAPATDCVPDIGKTYLYLVDFYGKSLFENGIRWQDIGLPGMADTPQVIFREGGGLDLAVGVKISDAASLCGSTVVCPFDSDLFGKLQRGRWYIQDDE